MSNFPRAVTKKGLHMQARGKVVWRGPNWTGRAVGRSMGAKLTTAPTNHQPNNSARSRPMQNLDQGARRCTVHAQPDMRDERDEAAGEEARDVPDRTLSQAEVESSVPASFSFANISSFLFASRCCGYHVCWREVKAPS